MSVPPDAARPRSVLPVLLAGAVVEAALLVGLLPPLWLGDPAHRSALHAFEPLAALLGDGPAGVLRFALTCAAWLGGFGAALWLARAPLTAAARRALVLFPLLFAVTLLAMLPASSNDVYHYLMEGRILAVHGDNPMRVPPAAYPDDPLAWVIASWGDEPSRYGPAFLLPAAVVARLAGGSFTAAILGFKLLMTAALAGTVLLTAASVRRLRPGAALPAVVLLAWNPLALYEAAGNAHNDLLMLFWMALALYLVSRRWWMAALPAVAMGALTKYIAGLLIPVVLIEAFAVDGRAAIRPAAAGLALSAGLTLALYAPFWDGPDTFAALGGASGGMISSPGWLLRQALKHLLGWQAAARPVMILLAAAFATGVLLLLRRQAGGRQRLSDTAFWLLTLELATVSWWLWPWYALWLLPAAALSAGRLPAWLTAAVTGAALLCYIPINFRGVFWGAQSTDQMPLAVVLLLFLPPLTVALAAGRLPRRQPLHNLP